MALGDGIRRNVASVSPTERQLLRDAFVALSDNPVFRYPDGVSYWDKQNQIHQATHVHSFPPARGIAFLPWHRELTNRLEALLRTVDPRLSLHYWDWTTNPRNTGDACCSPAPMEVAPRGAIPRKPLPTCPAAEFLSFAVETPDGDLIEAAALPAGVERVTLADVAYFRFTLPVPIGAGARTGTWHAILTVDDDAFKKYLSVLSDRRPDDVRSTIAHGIPYNLSVHALSDLQMTARLLQTSNEPGAQLDLHVTLTEAEVPFAGNADVHVQLTSPDNTVTFVQLATTGPGIYQGNAPAPLPGIYLARFLTTGTTRLGSSFTRDQLRTGAVWRGGDSTPPDGHSDPRGRDEDLCRLIACLEKNDGIRRFLEERGIKPDEAFRCLDAFCEARIRPGLEQGI